MDSRPRYAPTMTGWVPAPAYAMGSRLFAGTTGGVRGWVPAFAGTTEG